MKEKKDIVENWLPRYTGTPLSEFGEYVLLTNFDNYVEWFATAHGGLVKGMDRPMPNATADGITLINFGMGSPNAATVMDLLSAIAPKAVLFLGKCGGLKRKNKVGDLILPIAAIRGEGTSNDYLPPEVPTLPAFELQRAVSQKDRDLGYDYWTGTVYDQPSRLGARRRFRDQLRVREAWHRYGDRDDQRAGLPTTFRPARCYSCRSADDSRGREDEASDRA
jgi:AMP nucleosidase